MQCKRCGKPRPKGYRQYCSAACRMAAWKKRQRSSASKYPPKVCKQCSGPVYGVPSDKHMFCSPRCRDLSIRKQIAKPDVDDAFGNWFAGLIDGEGHFGLRRMERGSWLAFFVLQLRDDDAHVLRGIRDALGFGTFTLPKRKKRSPNEHPLARLDIATRQGTVEIMKLLRSCLLYTS